MDDVTTDMFSDAELEILPPEPIDKIDTASCICCCRLRPKSTIDQDGCGICNECLAA